jgi:hypothetical protein
VVDDFKINIKGVELCSKESVIALGAEWFCFTVSNGSMNNFSLQNLSCQKFSAERFCVTIPNVSISKFVLHMISGQCSPVVYYY